MFQRDVMLSKRLVFAFKLHFLLFMLINIYNFFFVHSNKRAVRTNVKEKRAGVTRENNTIWLGI